MCIPQGEGIPLTMVKQTAMPAKPAGAKKAPARAKKRTAKETVPEVGSFPPE